MNLEDKARYEEVREAIAQLLAMIGNYHTYNPVKPVNWYGLSEQGQNEALKQAEQILSLKDKDGKPMIGIISADQSLPHNKYDRLAVSIPQHVVNWMADAYKNSQQDMLISNFRRVIIVEDKDGED